MVKQNILSGFGFILQSDGFYMSLVSVVDTVLHMTIYRLKFKESNYSVIMDPILLYFHWYIQDT